MKKNIALALSFMSMQYISGSGIGGGGTGGGGSGSGSGTGKPPYCLLTSRIQQAMVFAQLLVKKQTRQDRKQRIPQTKQHRGQIVRAH